MNKLSDLTPDTKNANRGSQRGTGQLENSLRQYGAGRSILLDADNNIIAGNKTAEAAASIGIENVRIIETDGTEIIAVKRTDLHIEDKQARELAIADNRIAQVSLEWDSDVLAELIGEGVDLSGMWFPEELEALLNPPTVTESGLLEDADPDACPVDVETRCKPGDLWQLGRHRLLCGSCREFSDVQKLLGNERVNVAVTSPPYASQRKYDEASGFEPIRPDDYKEWFYDVQANIGAYLADDGSFFLNIKEHCEEGQRHLYVKDLTIAHVREWGWRFVDELCWKHAGFPISVDGRFKNGWEPVFHFTKQNKIKFDALACGHESEGCMAKGAGKQFNEHGSAGIFKQEVSGIARPSNVLEIHTNNDTVGHAAPYPVALPEFFIKAFSDADDIVFDPFMGSGTTLIAAERTGRQARGTEISPKYCDVILTRWEQATGRQAELITDDGTTSERN